MPTDTNSSTAPDRLGVDEHEAAAALGLSVLAPTEN